MSFTFTPGAAGGRSAVETINTNPAQIPLLPFDVVPPGEDPDQYWTSANFDIGFLP